MIQVFIDTETTGIDPKENSIVQLSGFISSSYGEEYFDFHMRPYKGDIIDPGASEKTGYTQEMIESWDEPTEIIEKFVSLLNKHGIMGDYNNRATFIGYNANFDMNFIREWMKFYSYEISRYFFFPYIDVMTLSAFYLAGAREYLKNFKQETVYEYIFKEKLDGAHNSLSDIVATKRLFYFLCDKMLFKLLDESKLELDTPKPPTRQVTK